MVVEAEDDKVPLYKQYISVLIIIINILVFIVQVLDPTGNMLIPAGAFYPSEFFAGERVWTIFTSTFMHADWVHITMNLAFFIVVADNCEKEMGHIFFLITYLLSGLVGSLLHGIFAIFVGWGDIPSLGASGAIMGIIAVYGTLFPKNKLKYIGAVGRTISARMFILITFATELIYGLTSMLVLTGTAHFAHVGGMIVGFICAGIFKIVKRD